VVRTRKGKVEDRPPAWHDVKGEKEGLMSADEILNKAKGLWAEIVALQLKIEVDEPKSYLLSHAAAAKSKLDAIIDDLEKLAEESIED
jgi:hypothetical protein